MRATRHSIRQLIWAPLIALLICTMDARVDAHGGRVPLAFWGAFPNSALRCQRTIAAALSFCTRKVVAARDTCQRALLTGATCDSAATEASVQGARNHALDEIDARCNDQQTALLSFLGVIEVQADMTRNCRLAEDYFVPRLYAPAPSADEVRRGCILAAADATIDIQRSAMRAWRAAFDRIAARNLSPQTKTALLDIARRRIDHAIDRAIAGVEQRCTSTAFASTYQQSPQDFFAAMAKQVECAAGAAYVQDRIQCDATPTATMPSAARATPTPTAVPTG